MKSRAWPSLLILFFGLTACGSDTRTITWKEEVALHDGKTIIVTRSVTTGGGRMEPGAQTLGESNYTLDFTTPDGRLIHWENPGHLRLMTLGFLDGTPYLVTRPAMVSDYARYKCPNPAYVFYKYEKDWQRVEFKVFPSDISKANLSPSVDGDQYVMAAKGTMTAEDVRYLLATVNKHKRAIDPNRRSPDSCEKTRFLD